MSTTETYNFSNFIENFNNETSSSLNWAVLFNDVLSGVTYNNKVIQSPDIFGNSVAYEDGLQISGSSSQLLIGDKLTYTIPNKTTLAYVGPTGGLSSVTYKITNINNPTSQFFRSYDLFENISNKLLEDNFTYENTFIGVSNSTSKIGVSIIKPPSKLKIRNKNLYVHQIQNLGAIGESGYCEYNELCDSSTFSENERIISLVYYKNGKYYNIETLTKIEDYSMSGGYYNMMYCGSNNFSQLNLSKIGTDGRKIKTSKIDTSNLTSKYVIDEMTKTNLINTSFYPTKESNTYFNVNDVSSNTPMEVKIITNTIGDATAIKFIVELPDGTTLQSNLVTVYESSLKPEISVIDYSKEYSIEVGSVEMFYGDSNSGTIDASSLSKWIEPLIIKMKGDSIPTLSPVYFSDILLYDNEDAYVMVGNLNNKTYSKEHYKLYKKVNGSYVETFNYNIAQFNNNLVIRLIDRLGEYKLVTHIESLSEDGVYPSKELTTYFNVLRRIKEPVAEFHIVDLGNSRKLLSLEVTQEDGVDCYFSIDGEEPSDSNTFISKISNGHYPIFNFEKTTRVKAYSYDGVQKSTTIDVIGYLTKTIKLDPPVIHSNYNTTTKKYDISITNTIGAIYYSLDGTTPNENSDRYENTFSVSPIAGNKITIKAYSIQSGSISSDVTISVLEFNYSCSPWRVEKGSMVIDDNKVKLNSNTLISRIGINSDNYVMKFEILDWNGVSDITIMPRESLLDVNNYSVGYYYNVAFLVSNVYSNQEFAVICLGNVYNNFDRSSFKKSGELVWNKSTSLFVEYIVNNNWHSLRIHNQSNTISCEEYSLKNVSIPNPMIHFQSLLDSLSNFSIGNIEIECK